MNDQYVAVGLVRDGLADALAEQPLEDAWLSCADDNQIRTALSGKLDDRIRRIPDRGPVVRGDSLTLQICPRVRELLAVLGRRVDRIDRPARTWALAMIGATLATNSSDPKALAIWAARSSARFEASVSS